MPMACCKLSKTELLTLWTCAQRDVIIISFCSAPSRIWAGRALSSVLCDLKASKVHCSPSPSSTATASVKVTVTEGINAYLFLNQCFTFTWIHGRNKIFNLPEIHPTEKYKYTWNIFWEYKTEICFLATSDSFLCYKLENQNIITVIMVFLSRVGGKVPCSHRPAVLLTFLIPEQLWWGDSFGTAAGCLYLLNIYFLRENYISSGSPEQ